MMQHVYLLFHTIMNYLSPSTLRLFLLLLRLLLLLPFLLLPLLFFLPYILFSFYLITE